MVFLTRPWGCHAPFRRSVCVGAVFRDKAGVGPPAPSFLSLFEAFQLLPEITYLPPMFYSITIIIGKNTKKLPKVLVGRIFGCMRRVGRRVM